MNAGDDGYTHVMVLNATPEVPPPHREPPENEPVTPIFPDMPPSEPAPPETEPEPV